MRKTILLIIFILSILIINGCTTTTTTTTTTTIPTPDMIPDAKSDETYSATITAQGVTPFTCKQVGATDIGGTLTLAQDCVISGTAPHAIETKIIPFKVEMTDTNGNSNILDMTLTVHPPPVHLELDDRIKGTLGETFKHSFCNPDPGMNCGADSINPTGGNPPYTFTISGQPIGLIMSLNGDLTGTIPENANPGEYPVEVCVKDTKGDSDCGNTIIDVKDEGIKGSSWTGKYTSEYSDDVDNYGYILHRTEVGEFSFTVDEDGVISGKGIGNSHQTQTGDVVGEGSFDNLPLIVEGSYSKYQENQFNIQVYYKGNAAGNLFVEYEELWKNSDQVQTSGYLAFPKVWAEFELKAEDGAIGEKGVKDVYNMERPEKHLLVKIEIHKVE